MGLEPQEIATAHVIRMPTPMTVHLNLDLRRQFPTAGLIVDVSVIYQAVTYALQVEVGRSSERNVERQAEAVLAAFQLGLRICASGRG